MNIKLYFKIAAWSIVWSVLSFLIWRAVFQVEWYEVIASAVADGILFGISVWVLINGLRNYTPTKGAFAYISSWVFVLTVVTWVLGWVFCPPVEVNDVPRNIVAASTGFMLPMVYYLVALSTVMGSMERRHQQQLTTLRTQLKLNQEAGMREMQHRFQPHFLYNSLNTINALIGSRPVEARETVVTLSDLLRRSVAQANESVHDLQQELDLLQQYLLIEQRRFGDRLCVEFRLPEELPATPVPPFLLQPVLENAIKFGLYGTLDDVNITVDVQVNGHEVQVEVRNPFDPDSTMTGRKGTQSGLRILRRRLQLLHYRNDLLETTADGNTFVTKILLPVSLPK